MKKIIGLFLVIAFCSSSNFSGAQMTFNLPQDGIADEPIGVDPGNKNSKAAQMVSNWNMPSRVCLQAPPLFSFMD